MLSKARKDTKMRNTRGRELAVFLAVLLLVFCGTSLGQVVSSPGPIPHRITAPVDDAVRSSIAKSTHPLAQAQYDRGPVDAALLMERMILVLGVSPEQDHQLRTFLDSQQTKGSPDFHHWLTPEVFGQKFGPSPLDVQQVDDWLRQEGFRVGSVAKSGLWIEFSGNAAQVQAAFQTQMRNYQVEGKMHLANASDISIPAALAPVVRGVRLHDFFSKPRHTMGSIVHGAGDGANPNATLHDSQGNIVHALSPGDFALIYDLNPLYSATPTPFNGSGQTIAIVARSDIDPGDIVDFMSVFGLPGGLPCVITNGPYPGDVPGDDVEATLDVEWSRAVATRANIELVISASTATTDGVDLSASYIVDNNLAPVMSVSFNLCEQLLGPVENQFINALAQQAAAQGISVFVSAGDDGAAACDDPNNSVATGPLSVGGLSSPPYVTAVGGTEFNETVNGGTDATYWNSTNSANLVSSKGYIPERVWNESCSVATCGSNANLFAGSGGMSGIYPAPSWQSPSTGIPGLTSLNRALPDVSLAAAGGHDGYLFCFQRICEGGTSFFVIGGTSASSPALAGIMAIIDQKIGSKQGLANYVLYPLAQNEIFSNCNSSTIPLTGSSCVFNDNTVGNNTVPGETGFNAGLGFDLASGLGSVDATNLANAWAKMALGFQGVNTTLAPGTAITATHGQAVSLTVNVARQGTTGTPSGNISLIASGGTLLNPVGVAGEAISPSMAGTATTGAFNVSNLPGGTAYTLTAHYPGDGLFKSGDSNPVTVTVTPENSTTTLTSIVGFDNNGNPITGTTIPYGGFLDLRTVVASVNNTSPPDGFPSGKITLSDNSAQAGTLNLNTFAQAELINCLTPAPFNSVCLTVGSHPIQVVYNGDNGFSGSSTANPAVTITVTKGNPGVAATAPATAKFNTPITVQASVFPTGTIFPTGTVQFFQGTTALGPPLTLAAGNPSTASTQVTLSGSGNQSITVQYTGDATYNGASSPPTTVNVTPPFNFSATTTFAAIAAGATATYNVTLNAVGGFTGSVSFACTGAPAGSTCAVSPNPATLGTSDALTVTVSNTRNARSMPAPFRTWPVVFAGALAGLLWGVRRKPRSALLLALAVTLVVVGVGSCGGGTPRPPTVATLTVTGTSGSATNSITLNLTVTH
jgi:hypothetical protein